MCRFSKFALEAFVVYPEIRFTSMPLLALKGYNGTFLKSVVRQNRAFLDTQRSGGLPIQRRVAAGRRDVAGARGRAPGERRRRAARGREGGVAEGRGRWRRPRRP